MRNPDNYREKGRAVVLAALMVLSVFAIPIAFTGTAGATEVTSADRDITSTQLAPGESTEVTVTINTDNSDTGPSLTESFDPAFDDVSAVSESPSATLSGPNNANDEYVAAWSGQDTTYTATYEVTIPSDASDGDTFDISGSAEVDGTSTTVSGDTTITVQVDDGNGGDGGDQSPFGGADDAMTSGETFWQGQELLFDGSNLVAAGASASDRTFQIRRVRQVDGADEVGNLVTEFTVASDDRTKDIETDNLEGDYVIVYNSNVITIDSDGVGSDAGDSVEDAEWEIAVQTLTTEFDEGDITQDETDDLEIDSNRGSFTVNISSDGLDEDDLADIFAQDEDGNDVLDFSLEDEDDDETIQIETTADGEIVANFTEFDTTGDYTFLVEVADTTAEDSASITVTEKDVTLNFAEPEGVSVFTENIGDYAYITVNLDDTDEAYLFIGDEDVSWLESIHLVDDNEDGTVEVKLNTFVAGRTPADDPNSDTNPNGDDFSEVPWEIESDDDEIGDDGVVRYEEGMQVSNGELDIDIESVLDDPIEEGVYDLRLASSNEIEDDGDLVDEEGVSALDLTSRSTDAISTHVAEQGAADDDDLEDYTAVATEGDTVAIGDRIGILVEASGLYGYVLDEEIDTLFNNGLLLEVEEANPGANQRGHTLDLQGTGVELFTDEENDQFLVVIDTRAVQTQGGNSLDDDTEYDVTFTIGGEDSDLHDDEGHFNPYVDDDEEQELETAFTVEDADADFNNAPEDELQALATSDSEISGTTNIAPGTELTVRIRSTETETPFLRRQSVTVQEDGSFAATFDLSDVPVGTEFETELRRDATVIGDTLDSVVVEEFSGLTPEVRTEVRTQVVEQTRVVTQTVEVTRTVQGPTPTPREVTRVVTRTVTQTPGQPGFGIAIALVALIAVALLGIRRRNQ